MKETQEFRERVARIETLLQDVESASDPAIRTKARELVQTVMELHGAGLDRILEIVSQSGEAGAAVIQSLGRDEIVSSLLVLYDLHPEDFETRVKRGLDKARSLAASHGASVHALAIGEGTVRVRIAGSSRSCGSVGQDLEAAVRDVLFDAAPDAVEVAIERAEEPASTGFVPLASLQSANGSARSGHPLGRL
jgi:Fe-S cluster biogenesis protein NfuA